LNPETGRFAKQQGANTKRNQFFNFFKNTKNIQLIFIFGKSPYLMWS